MKWIKDLIHEYSQKQKEIEQARVDKDAKTKDTNEKMWLKSIQDMVTRLCKLTPADSGYCDAACAHFRRGSTWSQTFEGAIFYCRNDARCKLWRN